MLTKDRRRLKIGSKKVVPMPLGPHTVGCVDLMTGNSKKGSFVRLYYPAVPPSDGTRQDHLWTPWLPNTKYLNGYSQFLRVWKPVFKTMYRLTVGDVFIPAVWDACPIQDKKLPLIIFSHGLASCRTSYSTICLEMASQGYMVAAIEHRDSSACHSYYMQKMEGTCSSTNERRGSQAEDPTSEECSQTVKSSFQVDSIREDVPYYSLSVKKKDYLVRNQQVRQRAKECLRALDLMDCLNNGIQIENDLDPLFAAERFRGTMDLDNVALAGHSFGGSTVILALSLELRFKVGIGLDTWMVPLYNDDDVMAMVSQPMLFINMERFQTKENLQVMSKLESDIEDRMVITVKGAAHLNQCDMPFICGNLPTMVLGGVSTINRFTAMDLTTRLMLAFLGKHFKTPINKDWTSYIDKHQKKLTVGINHKIKFKHVDIV